MDLGGSPRRVSAANPSEARGLRAEGAKGLPHEERRLRSAFPKGTVRAGGAGGAQLVEKEMIV